MTRTVIAFIVAPAVPAVLAIHNAGVLLAFGLGYFWSYILGVPFFFLIRMARKERHWVYASAGFSAAFLSTVGQGGYDRSVIVGSTVIGIIGLFTAVTFSLIRGPERRNA